MQRPYIVFENFQKLETWGEISKHVGWNFWVTSDDVHCLMTISILQVWRKEQHFGNWDSIIKKYLGK